MSGSIRDLLEALRAAASQGEEAVAQCIQASTQRLETDEAYARGWRQDLKLLFGSSDSTHLLTEEGILADEGLIVGVIGRLASQIAPAPPKNVPFEAYLRQLLRSGDDTWLRMLRPSVIDPWVRALLRDTEQLENPRELGSALIILATRIASGGLDPRLTQRLPALEAWQSPFIELSRHVDHFAEGYVAGTATQEELERAIAIAEKCAERVRDLRASKRTLGTTFHLSSSSLRMQQQLRRLLLLLRCTLPPEKGGTRAVAAVSLRLLISSCRRHPTAHFIGQKLDLLSYLAVGHAAQKGGKYTAQTAGDYLRFLKKSLIGGVLVAVFACLKIHLSHESIPAFWQAIVYGLNYAVCFVLIYLFGATLATKQPALTASRLAASLEQGADRESFAYLVRAIWRSQFISFVGNVVGAAVVALLIAWGFSALTGHALVDPEEARYLADKINPIASGSLYYAAIAGVLLSACGLFAGFVDNAMIFHRVGDRVRGGTGVFTLVPEGLRAAVAERLDKELGEISGNVLLGFLLGSAGVLGYLLGVPFDIRHIAFSSGHGALSVLYAPELANVASAAFVLLSVLLIGLVNFLVSFGLTLTVAITSRRVAGIDWRAKMGSLAKLLREAPVLFFIPLTPDPEDVLRE